MRPGSTTRSPPAARRRALPSWWEPGDRLRGYAYKSGTILFVMSRREQNRRLFSPAELVILIIAVAGFVTGIVALATGAITI
jgi:hypothetical protein